VQAKVELEVIILSIEWWHCWWPWVVPNPQTFPVSTLCVAFRIFLVGKCRDFKFGRQVDHSRSQPMDDKLSLKWVWSCCMRH